jgi:hypothetical protein
MITVKIELWPHGREADAREIGRMYIANDGAGTRDRGNYRVAVCRRGSTAIPKPIHPAGVKATRVGAVKNYPRLAYNVWRLIARALNSAFPEEQGKVPPLEVVTEADREREIEEPEPCTGHLVHDEFTMCPRHDRRS